MRSSRADLGGRRRQVVHGAILGLPSLLELKGLVVLLVGAVVVALLRLRLPLPRSQLLLVDPRGQLLIVDPWGCCLRRSVVPVVVLVGSRGSLLSCLSWIEIACIALKEVSMGVFGSSFILRRLIVVFVDCCPFKVPWRNAPASRSEHFRRLRLFLLSSTSDVLPVFCLWEVWGFLLWHKIVVRFNYNRNMRFVFRSSEVFHVLRSQVLWVVPFAFLLARALVLFGAITDRAHAFVVMLSPDWDRGQCAAFP